jgi:hypothetical protein
MCHPGEPGDDVIGAARVEELGYLASPEFEADCAAAGVVRVGLRAVARPAGGAGPVPPGPVISSTTTGIVIR